jgi:uncharacterized protein YhaN
MFGKKKGKGSQQELDELRSKRDKLNAQIAELEQQLSKKPARTGGGTPAGEGSPRQKPSLE